MDKYFHFTFGNTKSTSEMVCIVLSDVVHRIFCLSRTENGNELDLKGVQAAVECCLASLRIRNSGLSTLQIASRMALFDSFQQFGNCNI